MAACVWRVAATSLPSRSRELRFVKCPQQVAPQWQSPHPGSKYELLLNWGGLAEGGEEERRGGGGGEEEMTGGFENLRENNTRENEWITYFSFRLLCETSRPK